MAVLAIGIGANSAMFSVVKVALLRPVPWEDPDRLVLVQEVRRDSGDSSNASTANYVDWREQNHVFAPMAPMRFVYFNLSDNWAEPERVQALRVTADLFRLIGVKPVLGQLFLPEEEQGVGDRVVVLANGFWRRRYGADPAIVGKRITVEGETCAVVGVLPDFPMFRVLNRALDIYAPLPLPRSALSRQDHSMFVYARLRPGVSLERARSEMDTIGRRLASGYPKTNTGWSVSVMPLTKAFADRDSEQLKFLTIAAAFVLLIACANIASLTLAWSVSRRKELAIRMALGASRLRIIRQLLTESLILAVGGGALGALIAFWTTAWLDRSVSHMMLGRMSSFRLDAGVFGFTAGISLLACVLFGLGPAIRSSKFEVNEVLATAGSRGGTARQGAGRLLIACEVALATMLLIGTAVVARSTLRLLWMERGIDPHNVLTAQIWLPPSRYAGASAERQFVDRMLHRVRAVPGVDAASVVNYPPLGIVGTQVAFELEGRAAPAREQAMIARFRVIDPEFFGTLRVPLVAGRPFTDSDADESRGAVIVSEAFARRFLPGEDPIGKRIRPRFPGGDAYWYPSSANLPLRIVGIARDVREDGIDVGPMPQMYLPYAQNPSRILHLLVRTRGAPLGWAAAVRSAVLEADRDEPVFDVKTYEEITEETFSRQSAFGSILGGAAALALILAATGIYALLAWSVSRRTREIGIRMAIGASPSDVAWFALREALGPALAGVAAGMAGSLALYGILTKLVAGVQGLDFAALAFAPAALMLIALAASVVPLRRAVHVDPVNALRFE
jgi:putative ABC transport system permease protein